VTSEHGAARTDRSDISHGSVSEKRQVVHHEIQTCSTKSVAERWAKRREVELEDPTEREDSASDGRVFARLAAQRDFVRRWRLVRETCGRTPHVDRPRAFLAFTPEEPGKLPDKGFNPLGRCTGY
jgi:hypothetical protein